MNKHLRRLLKGLAVPFSIVAILGIILGLVNIANHSVAGVYFVSILGVLVFGYLLGLMMELEPSDD